MHKQITCRRCLYRHRISFSLLSFVFTCISILFHEIPIKYERNYSIAPYPHILCVFQNAYGLLR